MIGYTPIFSKIVDSSLWCEPDLVVKVFLTMLAKKDGDNVVRGSAFNISQWAKKTEEEVLQALKVLSSPDTKRIEPQPFQGRRIERVDDGWLLLNGEMYQNLMRDINRRAYKARKESERRARKKSSPTTYESVALAAARNPRKARKSAAQVRAENESREKRSDKAFENGDLAEEGRIAAEGLPEADGEYRAATMQEKVSNE